ncbi:unnamed protein product [Lepeophtheirus salmonis]|uniref:(salmon louse) hypothetical protein n=1 Tax=Lepeophtheirus salmonis TaxID=72036 RepID=A0A7R8CEH0_LEPSM|nr:unnamed protein product [Lepeophtheirus salmonis]CAF2795925.1 unnamed protein product [Lepeophtheirus salmonis]
MLSADPSYGKRTIASTLQVQIRAVQQLRQQLKTLRRVTSPKSHKLGFRRGGFSLSNSLPPTESVGLRRVVMRREHQLSYFLHHQTPPYAEYSSSSHCHLLEKVCSGFQSCIDAVIEAEGGNIE